MTRKAIDDSLKGQGTPAWRWMMRMLKAGHCDRCGKRVTDERYSQKLRKMVLRRTCLECAGKVNARYEAKVREKLYPTEGKQA